MLVTMETNENKIRLAELFAMENSTEIGSTYCGNYYINTNAKTIMAFVKYSDGVKISLAENLHDCNLLLDELEYDTLMAP